MKTKTLILITMIAFVWTNGGSLLQSQEPLPDTVWTKKINNVKIAKFSPDGQYVFAGFRNSFLNNYIYKIETMTGIIVDTLRNNPYTIDNISLSPTGDTLLVSGTGYIWVWDVRTGDTIFTLPYGEYACITPDGKKIVTTTGEIGTDKPQILVIDIASKEIIKTFIGRYYYTGRLTISPDGKYFSFHDFRGSTGSIVLVDLYTLNEVIIFTNPNGSLDHPSFSIDSKYLVANSAGHEYLFIWDLETLKLHKTIIYKEQLNIINPSVRFPHFLNDNNFLIFSFFDTEDFNPQKVIVWDIEGDSVAYEYFYAADQFIDVSKDDLIAAVGLQKPNMVWTVNLLRPKWLETHVKDKNLNELKYTYANGKVKIFFDEEILAKPEINIYNILGVGAHCNVPVQNGVPVQYGNEIEMDLEYLTSGVYFVVVDVGGKRSVVKVMK
ncbi:MAG: hypothetical protein V1779_14440 [bacterium]